MRVRVCACVLACLRACVLACWPLQDGTTHYYKEYEMNALNQTWDLLLARPYGDGGGENSTRVDGKDGWDMQPPLHCATKVYGKINDPGGPADKGWSVEVALPLRKLAFNQLPTVNVPPRDGDYWRLDFSRVEYHVTVVAKGKSAPYYNKVANAPEDNWVWSPIGVIDMHNPDRWGMLQFSTEPARSQKGVGVGVAVRNPEWPLRESAMATYYAQKAYKAQHGNYTASLKALRPFIPAWLNIGQQAIDGTCAKGSVALTTAGGFEATFTAGPMTSKVTDLRYLTVTHGGVDAAAATPVAVPRAPRDEGVPSRALLAPSFVGTDFDKITVRKVAMPELRTGTSVVVQVVGSSINPVDWKIIEQRLFPGLPAAFPAKLGMDMAGVVVKVGPGCTRLKPGDEVWADLAADGLGAYATYAVAEEAHLGLKPQNLEWDSASVLPLVSMTSLASLKAAGAPWNTGASLAATDARGASKGNGNVTGTGKAKAKGPVVMVLGGSGGCGFTGIQMAKAFGASEIWTTTSFLNFDFVKTMGATKVFNYQTQDWTKIVPPDSVDVV